MAINKNHEFEELNGIKCGIVERNVSPQRVVFLKELLEFNGYTVVTAPTPPPKVAAPPPAAEAMAKEATSKENEAASASAKATADKPDTFTLGVTDSTFNPTNAIFGRLLKTKDGHVVTLAYWQQKDAVSNDEVPYYEST